MVKVWRYDYSEPAFTEVEIVSLRELMNCGIHDWLSGEAFGPSLPEIHIDILSNHRPADCIYAGGMWLVSEQLRKVLGTFRVTAQYIPVRISWHGKPRKDMPYCYLNPLVMIDCIDYERSKYTFDDAEGWQDYIDTIDELVIDEAKFPGHDLVIMGKCWTPLLIVSDELAQTVIQSGCTGVEFVPPIDWNVSRPKG